MTPEQRAADAVKACICADEDCLVGRIALAIRAAENETLERAAVELEVALSFLSYAGKSAAAVVRRLKHPEGER